MNLFGSNKEARRLTAGSLAHYEEPRYYTRCYASRRHDVLFYVDLVQQARPRRVLEYGCGNGRITLPMASAGATVVGVDASKPQLDDLRARLSRADAALRDRVTLVHGDMRSVRLRPPFDLVLCTFNTFLHLYDRTDVERFLGRVADHLAPKGLFVFDVSVPLCEETGRDPTRPYRIPRLKYPATGEVVRYAEYFDYDPITQVLNVTMEFTPLHEPQRAWTTPLTHRQFYPRELEALLYYNGFDVQEVRADFEQRPLDRDADAGVWFVRKARRTRRR